MQRLIAAGVAGLFLLGTTGTLGCGPDKKTVEPDKEIPLPKDGPSPVGVGVPGAGVKQPVGGQHPGTDQ
jgi:hypothetical protein